MFKKLEDLSKPTLLSKTAVKDIRTQAAANSQLFEAIIDDIIPKKASLTSYRLRSEVGVDIITSETDVLFVTKEKHLIPHLKLLHKYPDILPRMQIDKGGLKHIFDGASVMCPGLTSAGGQIAEVEQDRVVAIYVEGKEHALAVGITAMSSKQIREVNKGVGITTVHHLGDALWSFDPKKK